jgi:hypothetical protein
MGVGFLKERGSGITAIIESADWTVIRNCEIPLPKTDNLPRYFPKIEKKRGKPLFQF